MTAPTKPTPKKPSPATKSRYVKCLDCEEVFDEQGREIADDTWQAICDCGSSDNVGFEGMSDAAERASERRQMGIC